ncbi:Beta-xylosidase [compost metagenome]
MFLGVRPVDGKYSVFGRETFLAPIEWTAEGWPVVDNNEGTVMLEMTVEASDMSSGAKSEAAELSWKDEFDSKQLDHRWTYLLTSQDEQALLGNRSGYAALTGNKLTLRDNGPALFLGVRQQHSPVTVTTEMQYAPQYEGEEAGLAVRLNERGHLTLGIRRTNEQYSLIALMTDQGLTTALGEIPINAERIWLRIIAGTKEYELLYSLDGVSWNSVGAAPADVVSPEQNGGFTGALVGMYATGNGQEAKTPAYFDYFSYHARV